MTSPASASTALRLNATTTVPGVSERSWRAPTNSSGSLRSKTRSSASRERALDERQRVERAEQQDVPVLAGEQQLRPGGAALLVVGPLHLVEDEHLARAGRHLDGAADDRRVLVDRSSPVTRPTRSSPSSPPGGGAPPARASAAARRTRRGPARRGSASASCVLPEFVGPRCATTLSGSRAPLGKPDLDAALGAPHGGAAVGARRRAWRAARVGRSGGRERRRPGHRATVAVARSTDGSRRRRSDGR